MPTYLDIPKHLLSPDKKEEFMGWVKQMPAETWVKKDLVRAWLSITKAPFDPLDYIKIGL